MNTIEKLTREFHAFGSFPFRTTTNIVLGAEEEEHIEQNIEENEQYDQTNSHDMVHTPKRKRTSPHPTIFENLAKSIQESHSKEMEMFQQVIKPQSEMDLFFSSICKSVEKFNAIEQAKIKIEINRIVSQMEMNHLQNVASNQQIVYSVQTSPVYECQLEADDFFIDN